MPLCEVGVAGLCVSTARSQRNMVVTALLSSMSSSAEDVGESRAKRPEMVGIVRRGSKKGPWTLERLGRLEQNRNHECVR